MANAADTSTALYACAKCDGTGNIAGYAHIHGGACFDCEGTGKVRLRVITDAEKLQITICNIDGAVSHALAALQDDNRERAEYLLEKVIADMFTIGTENARVILADIAKGEWFNGATMEEGCAPAAAAADLCQWVINRGRAMKG